MKLSLTNPSVADKISRLHASLMERGLEDKARALWLEQAKMNAYIEVEFDLKAAQAVNSHADELRIIHERDKFRQDRYNTHIKPYEKYVE